MSKEPTQIEIHDQIDKYIQSAEAVGKIMDKKEDYSPGMIKKTLKALGLSASETVTVKNPVTGNTNEIVIQRDGTPESKLMLALSDSTLKREQKDQVLSMYLWERGKESSSMIVDIMRYKGQHTKETRAFTSQMRFDFESLVNMFSKHLNNVARDIKDALDLDIKKIYSEYAEYMKKENAAAKEEAREPRVRFIDFMKLDYPKVTRSEVALLSIAVNSIDTADLFIQRTKSVTENRMKQRGYGIYINSTGRPFTVFDNDIVEEVEKDKKRLSELEEDEKTI